MLLRRHMAAIHFESFDGSVTARDGGAFGSFFGTFPYVPHLSQR
jgi:hypothetical protein